MISEAIDFLDADVTGARALMRDWLKMPARWSNVRRCPSGVRT